jgi:hypothetical protein
MTNSERKEEFSPYVNREDGVSGGIGKH